MPSRARKLTPLSRRLRYGRRQALWVLLAAALASVQGWVIERLV